jgi:bis(5'-nucleosyl)-tetraphosphatase (symmetrical)
MPTYAIGDIQGCDDELGELLTRIHFKPDRDRLWFVGDLVNRGPKSLAVLRRVHALGGNASVVLGNHDLHLLAIARSKAERRRNGDTLDEVLDAPDREKLLDWLQGLPLLHYDPDLGLRGHTMIHAGLPPQWDLQTAQAAALEVQQALADDPAGLFEHMYGDKPNRWSDDLTGYPRLRFIVNCLTRLRFCDPDGRIDLRIKDGLGNAPAPFLPWFRVPGRRSRHLRIVCGHWSALGLHTEDNIISIDTGCVWGGSLCAWRLDEPQEPVLLGCPGYRAPGK